jgi:hypothetical protein
MPGADPRLFRALDRCGPTALSRTCYERLAAIAAGLVIEVLLASDKPLDAAYIRYVARLPEADAVIRRLPPRLLADQSATEALMAVVALLRAYRLDVDAALARLPKAAGVDAVYRRLAGLLGALEATPATRPLPPGVQQITTVAALREAGRSLGLCVRDAMHGGAEHWLRLVSDTSIYVIHNEPRILIEMRQVAPDLWMLGEAKRANNLMPPPGTMRALLTSFAASGWRLVDTDPMAALVTLACRSDKDFEHWDRSLGRVLSELDHEWA